MNAFMFQKVLQTTLKSNYINYILANTSFSNILRSEFGANMLTDNDQLTAENGVDEILLENDSLIITE